MNAATPRQVQQALAYLAALHSGDPQREQQATLQISRWRQRSEAHEQAWQDANQRWQLVHGMTAQLREQLPPRAEPHAALSRRTLLRGAVGVLALAGVGGWLGALWRREIFDRQLLTAHGQAPQLVELADGTQLVLAAESNLQVQYDISQRAVMLLHGNVYFDVAHERLRRFLVRTRLGEVEVLGTAFSVIDRGDGVRVEVGRGRVKVRDRQGNQRLLGASQAVTLGGDGQLGETETTAAPPMQAQWQRGWWTFTNTRLCDVVAELNAYIEQEVLCDAAVADLRLTGSFPIAQPQQVLHTLTRALPVRLTSGDGQPRLVAR